MVDRGRSGAGARRGWRAWAGLDKYSWGGAFCPSVIYPRMRIFGKTVKVFPDLPDASK